MLRKISRPNPLDSSKTDFFPLLSNFHHMHMYRCWYQGCENLLQLKLTQMFVEWSCLWPDLQVMWLKHSLHMKKIFLSPIKDRMINTFFKLQEPEFYTNLFQFKWQQTDGHPKNINTAAIETQILNLSFDALCPLRCIKCVLFTLLSAEVLSKNLHATFMFYLQLMAGTAVKRLIRRCLSCHVISLLIIFPSCPQNKRNLFPSSESNYFDCKMLG